MVYQPEVNFIMGGDNENSRNPATPIIETQPDEEADETATQLINNKRRKSQPSLPASAAKNGREPLEELELESQKSVEYVYRSPSKMTSPEKKAFA